MFCKNCGTEMGEDAAFCPNCGTRSEASSAQVSAGKKAVNNKVVGIAACAAIVLAVIVIFSGIFSGGSYEDVAKECAIAEAGGDYDTLMDNFALDADDMIDDMMEKMASISGMTVKEMYAEVGKQYDIKADSASDLFKAMQKEAKESLTDEYGKHKISAKVVSSEKLDDDELDSILSDFESTMGGMLDIEDYINPKKIKDGYTVTLDVEIKGKEKTDTLTVNYTIVKYKGKWKLLDESAMNF